VNLTASGKIIPVEDGVKDQAIAGRITKQIVRVIASGRPAGAKKLVAGASLMRYHALIPLYIPQRTALGGRKSGAAGARSRVAGTT
jgi:hypothetical protein